MKVMLRGSIRGRYMKENNLKLSASPMELMLKVIYTDIGA